MADFDRLYARAPVWAQHAAVSAFGLYWYWLRFGPGFAQYVREYEERDRFTSAQWQLWQEARLRELLRAAVSEVPYYQSAWSRATRAAALAGRLQELPLPRIIHHVPEMAAGCPAAVGSRTKGCLTSLAYITVTI